MKMTPGCLNMFTFSKPIVGKNEKEKTCFWFVVSAQEDRCFILMPDMQTMWIKNQTWPTDVTMGEVCAAWKKKK
jgi:hypothetical protein